MTFAEEVSRMDPVDFWVWLGVLSVLATGCFYGAFVFLKRSRLIIDTPTAKIRSAAQGFIELEGTARFNTDNPLMAPLTDSPCCWYRYEIEKKSGKDWRTIESGSSEEPFVIEDETGRCIVLPKGASVTPTDQSAWYGSSQQPTDRNPSRHPVTAASSGFNLKIYKGSRGFTSNMFNNYRYSEQRIYDGDPIYAIGHFSSLDERDHHRKKSALTSEIIKLWKQDKQRMLDRFDTDGDGKIDMQEWEQARQSAQRIASEKYEEQKSQQIIHTLSKSPIKGHPFLISSLPQFELARRYQFGSAFLLLVFFLAGSGSVFLLANRL